MKIKVSVLTKDKDYMDRFGQRVMTQFADKLELSVFESMDIMADILSKFRSDIILIDENDLDDNLKNIWNSPIAVFTEHGDFENIKGFPAICKYQAVGNIYKQLSDIYIDQNTISLKHGSDINNQRMITFFSASGGVGASTAAAACAQYLADHGKGVLYLNLETAGSADVFFTADGKDDFSKILYALSLSNKAIGVKIINAMKQDNRGVHFYSPCKYALDMMDFDVEMQERFYEELYTGLENDEKCKIDFLIVDMSFDFAEVVFRQIERSDMTILVSDGSENSNRKLSRILDSLTVLSEQRDKIVKNHIYTMYNRFASSNRKTLRHPIYRELGGINRIENATSKELVQIIAKTELFNGIFQIN